jgi:hypothetical protein
MIITAYNPIPVRHITHNIIKDDKYFVVEYVCLVTGRTYVERYVYPLTKREIEEEYGYIKF